jgi:hypothetical protein
LRHFLFNFNALNAFSDGPLQRPDSVENKKSRRGQNTHKVFNHVGLLFNEPLAAAELLFI